MGFMKLFRKSFPSRGPRPNPAPTHPSSPPDKARTLHDLVAIACSITNGTFRAARPFLKARYGVGKLISPFSLYNQADSLFLSARKLAKELGDRAKEAEVLYHWARLQYRPPQRGLMLAPSPLTGPEELARPSPAQAAAELRSGNHVPVESNPVLALQFFLEAIPLAEATGQDVLAAASLLYSAEIYKARGDGQECRDQLARLEEKKARAERSGTPLPPWLLDKIKVMTAGD